MTASTLAVRPKPHLESWRAARGRAPAPTPHLEGAVRLTAAAWQSWLNAGAHLVVAGRATAPDAAAWARDQLARWADAIGADDLGRLADELADEARATLRGRR